MVEMKKASSLLAFLGASSLGAWPRTCCSGLQLGFLGVGRAPTGTGHLLASKQRATASGVRGFTLVQSAVTALLASSVLGVFDFVRVSGVSQSCSLWVFFVHHGLSHGLRGCQGCAAQCNLHHENATVGLFHKNSSKVGNNLNGRILTSKKLER
jgi:hypothetical protein